MSNLADLRSLVRTGVALAILPAVILFHSLVAIAMALSGCTARQVHRIYVSATRMCLFVGGTKLLVHGQEHIEPGQAYVIVSNHEGNWDSVCLLAGLPQLVIRVVAKRQFMQIPVLGQALRLTGNVRVERDQTGGDATRIHDGMEQRDPDVSILFYAEGRRARDGALHPFKKGAFVTALDFGLPILPVAVAGMQPIWPPETLRLRAGTAALEIGEPIPVEDLGHDDRDLLRDRSFEAVRALRTRARERMRELGAEPGGID